MDVFEQKKILESFEIICDTREKPTSRAEFRYKQFGVPHSVGTLDYGDYCGNIRLINGDSLYDLSEPIRANLVIERKMNLDELASCFTRGRERFQREFERAKETGARIFLLCEDGSLDSLIRGEYRSKYNSNAFLASIIAWSIRYNMQLVFCNQMNSGRIIKEILYRDIKERLEKGEFDD